MDRKPAKGYPEMKRGSPRTLAEALRARLNESGLRQKDLCQKLNKPPSTVSLWVSGRQTPRLDGDLARRIAKFLGPSYDHADVKRLTRAQQEEDRRPGLTALRKLDEMRRILPSEEVRRLGFSIDAMQGRLREKGYWAPQEFLRGYGDSIPEAKITTATREGVLNRLSQVPERVDELFSHYRSLYMRQPWIREVIRDVCKVLEDEFVLGQNELERARVEEIIARVLGDGAESYAINNHSRALIEVLTRLGFVKVGDEGRARRLKRFSSGWAINRLFGLRTQIPGFDDLLDGGLLPPLPPAMSILVEGEPGAGKTILALQLAASLACQDHLAVYVSAEESVELLIQRLSFAGYSQRDGRGRGRVVQRSLGDSGEVAEFRLLTSSLDGGEESDRLMAETVGRSPEGCLVLIPIANRNNLLDPDDPLLENLTHLMQKSAGLTCVVLDSIDAVLSADSRRESEKLLTSFGFADFAIFTSDIGEGRRSIALGEFLADAVIKVGYRRRTGSFLERVIEFKKFRTQTHSRGQHMFAIHSDRGIEVYPSVQRRLSIWRLGIQLPVSPEVESWRLDESFDLDPILRGDVVRGDSILLCGPPATYKFPIGLSFLAAGFSDNDVASDAALLVSVRQNEPTVRRIVESYPQLASLLNRETGSSSGRLKVAYFPPDYFSAERFLHWMEETLAGFRRSGTRIRRFMLSTLSQLRHNSPMLEQEPLFVAALIELFKKESLTCLFVDAHPSKAGSDPRKQELENNVDSILFTEREKVIREFEDGEVRPVERIMLSVGHSGPCNADRNPREVVRLYSRGKGRLELRDVSVGRLETDSTGQG